MLDDVVFSPSNITLDNLTALAKKSARIAEQRACEISELADGALAFSRELYSSGMGIYEILSLVAEGFSATDDTTDGCELALGSAHSGFISSFDRAELALLFVDRLRSAGISISPRDLLPSVERDGRIVYVKNALADEAYDVFTADIENPTVSYAASLKDAADAVASGAASYCLLPLEERGGSRLAPVSEIIFRRDLRICGITPVFGFDGNADMKYALASKAFSIPEIYEDDDRYLEICLDVSGEVTLSEILTAADLLQILPYRVNTVVFYTEDGQKTNYSIVFKGEGKDYSDLLIYLTLFCGTYVPIGIYKNLE